jgi:hypothetical protein
MIGVAIDMKFVVLLLRILPNMYHAIHFLQYYHVYSCIVRLYVHTLIVSSVCNDK